MAGSVKFVLGEFSTWEVVFLKEEDVNCPETPHQSPNITRSLSDLSNFL